MSALTDLNKEIALCRLCEIAKTRTKVVPGEGAENAEIMFIGEAPGWNEDQQGRPFIGAAGQFLDELLASIKLKRADVYIANVIKCRPPENRDPLPAEIEAYKPYLTRQIAVIDPKLIVTLGRFSMNYFLPFAKITHDHGRPLSIDGRTIFPVYHPAAALRSTQMMETLRGDFKKIPGVLSGEFGAVELPPAFEIPAARKLKKASPEKPKQTGLF